MVKEDCLNEYFKLSCFQGKKKIGICQNSFICENKICSNLQTTGLQNQTQCNGIYSHLACFSCGILTNISTVEKINVMNFLT